MSGRLSALFWLAWSLALTLLRHAVPWRERGLKRFMRNYAADRLSPMTADDRTLLTRAHGCVACGRCDRGEGARIASSGGEYPGVMALVLSATRSTADFGHSARAFRHVPREALAASERQCPADVPIVELARFVETHAAHLRGS